VSEGEEHHVKNDDELMNLTNHSSIKLLPYISFEKCINILAFEMTSPENQHCATCIGTLSFPIGRPIGTDLAPAEVLNLPFQDSNTACNVAS